MRRGENGTKSAFVDSAVDQCSSSPYRTIAGGGDRFFPPAALLFTSFSSVCTTTSTSWNWRILLL